MKIHLIFLFVVMLIAFLCGVFATVALVSGPIKAVFEEVLDEKFPEQILVP